VEALDVALTEEEAYLWAILSDPSGIDAAEFLITDEENAKPNPLTGHDGTYCFRAWDFQYPWWRSDEPEQIDQGSRCLARGQKVLTKEGEKKVEEIQHGDYVLTHRDRWRRVVGVMRLDPQAVVRLEDDDGREIIVTPNHRLWVKVNGTEPEWLSVDDFGNADVEWCVAEEGWVWKTFHVRALGIDEVWDLWVEEDETCVVGGVVSHNSAGKSLSIRFRCLVFPIIHPGSEMVLTAPEGVHLDAITDVVESMFLNNRLPAELIVGGRVGIKHRPFHMNFKNGARIMGRIPQHDGKGLLGTHPLWLEQDEAQSWTKQQWDEIIETLKAGYDDARWRAHGVTRGAGDVFYEYTQPDSGWKVHHLPAMYRPTYTAEERERKIKKYGSRQDPDFRRNVYGVHGEATSPLFVLANLMNCVDTKHGLHGEELSEYNRVLYYKRRIDDGMVRYYDGDILSLIDPPPLQLERYHTFWMGMDYGQTVDPSVITVWAEEHKGKQRDTTLRLILNLTMERVQNIDQLRVIMWLIDHYKPIRFTMDATGAGQTLFSILQEIARDREDEDYEAAQRTLKSLCGYNFSEKIIVDFKDPLDDEAPKPTKRKGAEELEEAGIRRNVKDFSTDVLRSLVDPGNLILPYDTELIREFESQSVGYTKKGKDSYGRTRVYSGGPDHTLDSARMAVLGWKQHKIDNFIEEKRSEKPRWRGRVVL
jgi:hypothetical protein